MRTIEGPRPVRFRVLIVKIVDQNEIEVGSRSHFVTAQLSHGQHCGLLSPHVTMDRREIIGDRAMDGANDRISEPGKRFARLTRGDRSGKDSHANKEHVFQTKHAYAFEQVFVVARLGQCRIKPPSKFDFVRQGTEKARIDQCIHDLGMACQRLSQTGCNAEDQNDQRNEFGVLPEQRQ